MFRAVLLASAIASLVAITMSLQDPPSGHAAPLFNERSCDGIAPSPDGFDRSRMRCGFVTVDENRERSDTRTIEIWAVVIAATASQAQTDPVVFLSGGPGQAAVEFAAFTSEWYSEALDDRDFIAFDFRGTGLSGKLACNEYDQVLADSFVEHLTDDERLAREDAAIRLCRERYLSADVDLTTYDSATIVDDMVELMTALGYEEWNLIGGSYGTRLALTAMRDAPGHIRTAVLDAPAPPVVDVDLARARLFEGKLEKLWTECFADASCRAAYPNIDDTFWNLVESANVDPIEVDATTPDGVTVPVEIDGYGIIQGAFQAMQDTSLLGLIPFAIDDISKGNTGVLGQIASQLLFVDLGIATGMFWSVQCNEEWPFYTAASLRDATDGVRPEIIGAQLGGPTSAADLDKSMAFCDAWNDPSPDPIERQAVSSSIPTLILAGEFDPNTPTEFGEIAAATLSNGYVMEVPSSGHFVTFPQRACTNPLIAAFVETPDRAPDASCIREIAPVNFFVAGEAMPPPAATPPAPSGVITAPDTGKGPLDAQRHGGWALALVALFGLVFMVGGWVVQGQTGRGNAVR